MHKAVVIVSSANPSGWRPLKRLFEEFGIEVAYTVSIAPDAEVSQAVIPKDTSTCVVFVDDVPGNALPDLRQKCYEQQVVLVQASKKPEHLARTLTLAGFLRRKEAPQPRAATASPSSQAPLTEGEPRPKAPFAEPVEKPMSSTEDRANEAALSAESFEVCLEVLRAVLKTLRDKHAVSCVRFEANGLEVERRERIMEDLS